MKMLIRPARFEEFITAVMFFRFTGSVRKVAYSVAQKVVRFYHVLLWVNQAPYRCDPTKGIEARYSSVTDFTRFRGRSTSNPRFTAM
jgi:hypothetical protein